MPALGYRRVCHNMEENRSPNTKDHEDSYTEMTRYIARREIQFN